MWLIDFAGRIVAEESVPRRGNRPAVLGHSTVAAGCELKNIAAAAAALLQNVGNAVGQLEGMLAVVTLGAVHAEQQHLGAAAGLLLGVLQVRDRRSTARQVELRTGRADLAHVQRLLEVGNQAAIGNVCGKILDWVGFSIQPRIQEVIEARGDHHYQLERMAAKEVEEVAIELVAILLEHDIVIARIIE